MKCKHCDGKGYTYVRTAPNPITGYGYKRICDYCHGTGEIKQTEQKYLQTCNHKELTEILFRMIVHGSVIRPDRKYISEWLKQPHTVKE